MLHSALERPKASFSGKFLYHSLPEMGGAMLQSLVKNHPFVDGNKRTAFFTTLRFLEKNGLLFLLDDKDIVDLMILASTRGLTVKEIGDWFTLRILKNLKNQLIDQ